MANYLRNSHTVSSLSCHLVWATKYRYPVLTGDIQRRCRDLLIQIKNNRIELTERLEQTFMRLWKRYVGTSIVFQPKIATPFWHLQNEPFGSLYLNDGKDLSTVTSPYSVKRLRENTHAIMDSELFALMQDEDCRARLSVTLIGQYLQEQHIPMDKSLTVLAVIGTLINLTA